MSSLVKNIIKYTLTLVLAVALVFYVLSTVNVAEMINKVKQAKLSWVILGVSINLLSHLSRARRWNLLMEPMGYKPKTHRTFVAVMVGYFANLFLPRMGEISRCAVLKRTDNVPIDKAFGTVVAERAFDFICLIILIGLSLILEFNRLTTFFSEKVFNEPTPTAEASLTTNPLLWGSAILGLCVLMFVSFREKIKNLNIYKKIVAFIKGVLEGVFSIRKLKRKNEFIFHTIFIWACYYFMTYLVFFSLEATSSLSPVAGLVLLVVGGLGMSAPVQGGFGAFHEFVSSALEGFYHLSKLDGLAFAVVIHTSQTLAVIIVGGAAVIVTLFLSRKTQIDDLR